MRTNHRLPARGRAHRDLPLLLGTALLALAPAAPALANDKTETGAQNPPDTGADSGQIVVTATKRKESQLEVPISMSAISANALQQRQITSFEDVARSVPGLAITDQEAAGRSSYAVRGVSSAGGVGSIGQQTVGVYLDDVSMTMPTGASVGAATPAFFDINHMELLRGPQGTLYGAGAMGGAIRVIANQADLARTSLDVRADVSANARGGLGYLGEGVINLPLIRDHLAARVGIQYNHTGGYIDRKDGTTGAITPNFNDSSQLVVRGQLRYENDGGDLQVVPSIFYQKTTTQGSGESDAGNANLVTRYTDEPLRDEIFAPSLTIRKNFGGYALTSATTYLKRSFYTATDYTISALGNELYGLVTPVSMALPTQISQVSEEMRLVSPKANGVDRKFEWILGVYFEHSDTHVANYLTAEENQTSLYDRLAAAYGADTADALTASGSNVYSQISTQSTTQFSGFGELSFKPNRRITATVGFRALTAHQSALTLTNGLIGTGSNSWSSDSSSLNSSAFTPKFSLRYELSRDANIYATAVKGFRLGGINQSVPTSTCGSALGQLGLTKAPMTYKPDSVWSYEGGFKGSLLHHRLDVAGAVYLIDWNGVQQTVNLQTYDNACPYTYVGNVGRARVMGTDLEFSAHLTRTLTLRANGGYTQAEIRTDNESTGTYRGEWLLGVPRWTGAAGFSYNGRADERTRLFGALDVHLIGPSRASFSASDVGYRRSPYATLDGSFGVDMAGTRVSLFAKNITNSRKITQQETASPYLVRALAPRTIGLSVQKSF